MRQNRRFRQQDFERTKWDAIFWWSRLLVAVLAIPSIAIIVASLAPERGAWQVVLFVVACWACTLLGMKLTKR